jgi:hypothetical protein
MLRGCPRRMPKRGRPRRTLRIVAATGFFVTLISESRVNQLAVPGFPGFPGASRLGHETRGRSTRSPGLSGVSRVHHGLGRYTEGQVMPGREDEKERERKRRDTAASEVGQSSGVVSGGRTWEAQAAAARPLQVGARYTIFGWFSLCLIAVFGLSGCPVLESVLVWRCFQSRIMIPVSESLAGFPPFGKGETTCGGTIRDYLATT